MSEETYFEAKQIPIVKARAMLTQMPEKLAQAKQDLHA